MSAAPSIASRPWRAAKPRSWTSPSTPTSARSGHGEAAGAHQQAGELDEAASVAARPVKRAGGEVRRRQVALPFAVGAGVERARPTEETLLADEVAQRLAVATHHRSPELPVGFD